jgi:glycosyltransferase involved in cell wall biosynthesis
VPVVSTAVGNVPELLGYDERFLAPSKDPEALAARVRRIHERPEDSEAVTRANRDKVERFFDKAAVYRRYREIYETLARSYGAWRESASS